MVSEDNVHVSRFNDDEYLVKVVFVPTVPHCSLASLIGNRQVECVVVKTFQKQKLNFKLL